MHRAGELVCASWPEVPQIQDIYVKTHPVEHRFSQSDRRKVFDILPGQLQPLREEPLTMRMCEPFADVFVQALRSPDCIARRFTRIAMSAPSSAYVRQRIDMNQVSSSRFEIRKVFLRSLLC